jgi:hypothetical protein
MKDKAKQIEFINNILVKYLEHKYYKNYDALIEATIKSDDLGAKYNLWTLFMNNSHAKREAEQLVNRLSSIYCDDKNIEKYLDSIIWFNPKLGYVEITAKSKQDSRNDGNLGIKIAVKHDADTDKYFAKADSIIETVKEVLRMILLESRTVSPE